MSIQPGVVVHSAHIAPTSNCKHSRSCTSNTPNSGLAGVLSIMGLLQWVDGEGVGWCTAHSEVTCITKEATWPYPLHSGCPSESSLGSNSAGEGVGLPSCWVCPWCDGDQV